MKLAAIYNLWDGEELLRGSVKCIEDHVDAIIIVYQSISNFGEVYCPLSSLRDLEHCYFVKFAPEEGSGFANEKRKRNLGITVAKGLECTHFIAMDCDEYYPNFGAAKQLYIDSGKEGSVCKMMTYFKDPTLCFENPDNYYVPFIHKLNPNTETGLPGYPFYVDPTRAINTTDVIELPILMHHFSWVRKDIKKKIRNSSAKNNIACSNLEADYFNPNVKEGYFVKDFGQKLMRVPNVFSINIPHLTELVL
jgi:hypothetical protein